MAHPKLQLCGAATLLLLMTDVASAYDWPTHRRITVRAVESMEALSDSGSMVAPVKPAGANTSDWNDYLAAVEAAPTALRKLRTGLPIKLPQEGASPFPGGTPRAEDYPFPPGSNCKVHPEDNLSQLQLFKIYQLRYEPQRNGNACGLVKRDDSDKALQDVLGWHAGSVDDHYQDSVLWLKPTNSLVINGVTAFATSASNYTVGMIVAAAYCFIEFLSGDACELNETLAVIESFNPVNLLDGVIPGFGDIRGEDYTGLWHHINVENSPGRFNLMPGLYYPEAGPGNPGVLDLSAMVAADLSGLTLNSGASTGDDRYGGLDETSRTDPIWMAETIGHTEFSSLDNLAEYGWNRFIGDGATSAEGLAWPLHAIGDAAEPHHVVASSAWGHRPYESGVDARLDAFFPTDETDAVNQMDRVLAAGFEWWMRLQNDPSIEQYIRDLATETHDRVEDADDWAYIDGASTDWQTGDAESERNAENDIIEGNESAVLDLLELGCGATVGFLAFAAEHANEASTVAVSCSSGATYYAGEGCITTVSGCQRQMPSCTDEEDCPDNGTVWNCESGCCEVVLH